VTRILKWCGLLTVLLLPLRALEVVAGESVSLFDKLVGRYNQTPQTRIEFRHIVRSDFFETADTVDGTIVFADDGRYLTRIGGDEYLFDGRCLWEYSKLYAQATRNCLKPGQRLDDSFLFFRHFGEYYDIKPVAPDSIYHLLIHKKYTGKAPDSMTVILSPTDERIVSMEYYDINDELNRILIGKQTTSDTINASLFQPDFPDSTEIIETPG